MMHFMNILSVTCLRLPRELFHFANLTSHILLVCLHARLFSYACRWLREMCIVRIYTALFWIQLANLITRPSALPTSFGLPREASNRRIPRLQLGSFSKRCIASHLKLIWQLLIFICLCFTSKSKIYATSCLKYPGTCWPDFPTHAGTEGSS